jgi:hypothetical protein
MTTDTIAPTREQQKKFEYIPPTYDGTESGRALRQLVGFARIKSLEPEHKRAVSQLEVHFWGARGVRVSFDDNVRIDHTNVSDEFADHRHKGLLENAKKAVGSPRVWAALVCQLEETYSPQEIGHIWAGKKSPTGAKSWGEGLIIAGLDTLCVHWGIVSHCNYQQRPPD